MKCAKLRASRALCPTCLTCLRALIAYMPYVPSYLCFLHAFLFYLPHVPSFFYVPYVPLLFYVSSFFNCLHFIYIYANKIHTQIKENLFTFIKYFHFYKTRVIFCMIFFLFLKRKILITFNAKENS